MGASKITLIVNSDSFRVRQYLRSFETDIKSFSEQEIAEFVKEIQQQTLFNDDKLLVLFAPINKLSDQDLQAIKASNKRIVLWDKSKKLNEKTLEKNKLEYTKKVLPTLKGNALYQWIKETASEKYLELSREAINKLIYLHGSNLFFLENDLSVLHLFYNSSKSNLVKISSLPSNLVGTTTIDFNLFDFLDAIGNKDTENIIKKIHYITEATDEWAFFFQLVGHLRKLLTKKLGRNATAFAFIEKKLSMQSNEWSEAELEKGLVALLETELAVKKGETELKPELVNWILQTAL